MPVLDRGSRALGERAMIDSTACRSVSLVVIALLSPLARGAMLSSSLRAEATRPNVIFLLVDDLGYGDIGGYGVTDIRTPQLDRLAQDGAKLTDCYANGPVCSATRAAFITGRYQQRAGFERAISPWEKDPGLPVSETSIAKLLKRERVCYGALWQMASRIQEGVWTERPRFRQFLWVPQWKHRSVLPQRETWSGRPLREHATG